MASLYIKEAFRFWDENDCKDEVSFELFATYATKNETPETFIYWFFTSKASTVIYIEGGQALSW